MEWSGQIRELLQGQIAQNRQLEEMVARLEQSDFLRENSALKEEVARYRQTVQSQTADLAHLAQENKQLKTQLMEQMYAQRSHLIAGARQQADVLFGREEQAAVNRLAAHNNAMRIRLDTLRRELEPLQPQSGELVEKITSLEQECKGFMYHNSLHIQQKMEEARAAQQQELEQLAAQPISPQQVVEKTQQNSLELKIGGRFTVIVGVFFMLLAVVFGLRYTYLYLLTSDLVKGLVAYAMGALFVGAGELMSRKHRGFFATGILAGGVAILFASTAMSYFSLRILSMPVALLICALVTALALLQSYRYNSQLVATFALVGGYLPIVALRGDSLILYGAMAYFLILNLFVLLLALGKRWQPLKFFGLLAGFAGMGYLLQLQGFANLGANLIYVLANFLLYLAMILSYPVLKNVKLRQSDLVLLGLNTFFGCGYLYRLLYVNSLEELSGVVALSFCIVFFALALLFRKILPGDIAARGLLYATSFAFWVLTVPLQFEPELISLGWLCEGVALCVFGILTNRKWYRRAGAAVTALCFGFFLLWDCTLYLLSSPQDPLFPWRYGALALGALVILAAALYKGFHKGAFSLYRLAVLANTWIYLLYLSTHLLYRQGMFWRQHNFWQSVCWVVITLGLAVVYRAIPYLRDKLTQIFTWVLYSLGFLMVFYLGTQPIHKLGVNTPVHVLAWILFLAVEFASALALFDLAKRLRLRGKMSDEWFPVAVSCYGIILCGQLLSVQLQLRPHSIWFSMFLLACALGTILFGFIRRYSFMRRMGLILILGSTSKLFLVDLMFLPSGQRILSYFLFGVVLIGISYLYNLFSRRLFPVAAKAEDPGGDVPAEDRPGPANE